MLSIYCLYDLVMVLFKIKNANDVLEFIANHIFQKLVNFTYLDFRDL